MPEKSGMDAASRAPLLSAPAASAGAAANIANKGKARCLCTPTSCSWFVAVTSDGLAFGGTFRHRYSVPLARLLWTSFL
jgi:hypothetical protein